MAQNRNPIRRVNDYLFGGGFDLAEGAAVLFIAIIRWLILLIISLGVITGLNYFYADDIWGHVIKLVLLIVGLGIVLDIGRIATQESTLPKLPEPEPGDENRSINARLIAAKERDKTDPDKLREAAKTAATQLKDASAELKERNEVMDLAELALREATNRLDQARAAYKTAEDDLRKAEDSDSDTQTARKHRNDAEKEVEQAEKNRNEFLNAVILPRQEAERAKQAVRTKRDTAREAEEKVHKLTEAVEILERHIRIRKRQRAYYNRAALTVFLVSVLMGTGVYFITEMTSTPPTPNRGLSIFVSLAAFVLISWWQIQSRPLTASISASNVESSEVKKAENLARLFEETDEQKEALAKLFQHTVTKAQGNIDWYTRNARIKKRRAQIIRLLSLSLLGIGSVTPVLLDLYPEINIPTSIATLIIAAGTGLIALDRFWGYSTGWMRFLTTEMRIKMLLESFEYDWYTLINRFDVKQPGLTESLITRCATLRDQINSIVQEETNSWVEEFRASLRTYDISLKALSEGSQPGAINVIVECNAKDEEGWVVVLDDKQKYERKGRHAALINIPAGQHRVSVQRKGDSVIVDEKPVIVISGQIQEVSLRLSDPKSS